MDKRNIYTEAEAHKKQQEWQKAIKECDKWANEHGYTLSTSSIYHPYPTDYIKKVISPLQGIHSANELFLNCFREAEPDIYHFTHLSNAIQIIKQECIKGRKALRIQHAKFDNSAGSNITTSDKAYDYARFYFKTHTPTQFYNEFLGKDIDDKYYDKYAGLNYPKVPFPVFFIIDLSEVLNLYPEQCYYSCGNGQCIQTEIFSVQHDSIMLTNLDTEIDNKKWQHREFLVLDNLPLSDLKSLEIWCYNEVQCRLLKQAVAGYPLAHKIKPYLGGLYPDPFDGKNKQLQVDDSKGFIKISATDFKDEYCFLVESIVENIDTNQLHGDNIKPGPNSNSWTTQSYIEISKSLPYKISLESHERIYCLYDNTEHIYG